MYCDMKEKIPLKDLAELVALCDDSTTNVTIATPDGWFCERENCGVDYLHKHTTYAALSAEANASDEVAPKKQE